jgi:hypothetical protein
MSISIALPVLLLIIFLVWLVLALVRGEAAATDFWWKLLIGVAVLATFGAGHLG